MKQNTPLKRRHVGSKRAAESISDFVVGIVSLAEFAKWTHGRNESEIIEVQARANLYVAETMRRHGGLFFRGRSDRMVCILNGCWSDPTEDLLTWRNEGMAFEFTVGFGDSPRQAEYDAAERSNVQNLNTSQPEWGTGSISVCHLDLDWADRGDFGSEFETARTMMEFSVEVFKHEFARDCIGEVVSGDNLLFVMPNEKLQELPAAVDDIAACGFQFKTAVGQNRSASRAADLSAQGLDRLREVRATSDRSVSPMLAIAVDSSEAHPITESESGRWLLVHGKPAKSEGC